MARGRGPHVAELRTRAAASAWTQRQNNSAISLAAVCLGNLGNLGTLGPSSGSIVGLVLGAVVPVSRLARTSIVPSDPVRSRPLTPPRGPRVHQM